MAHRNKGLLTNGGTSQSVIGLHHFSLRWVRLWCFKTSRIVLSACSISITCRHPDTTESLPLLRIKIFSDWRKEQPWHLGGICAISAKFFDALNIRHFQIARCIGEDDLYLGQCAMVSSRIGGVNRMSERYINDESRLACALSVKTVVLFVWLCCFFLWDYQLRRN